MKGVRERSQDECVNVKWKLENLACAQQTPRSRSTSFLSFHFIGFQPRKLYVRLPHDCTSDEPVIRETAAPLFSFTFMDNGWMSGNSNCPRSTCISCRQLLHDLEQYRNFFHFEIFFCNFHTYPRFSRNFYNHTAPYLN